MSDEGAVRVERTVRPGRNSKARELMRKRYPNLFDLTDFEICEVIKKYPPGVFEAMRMDAALNEIERLIEKADDA